MYNTAYYAFTDALKREGKVITAYSDNTPYQEREKVVLQINDFRELGYEYMRYCGYGNFINCND